jgi:hypothetical protein
MSQFGCSWRPGRSARSAKPPSERQNAIRSINGSFRNAALVSVARVRNGPEMTMRIDHAKVLNGLRAETCCVAVCFARWLSRRASVKRANLLPRYPDDCQFVADTLEKPHIRLWSKHLRRSGSWFSSIMTRNHPKRYRNKKGHLRISSRKCPLLHVISISL